MQGDFLTKMSLVFCTLFNEKKRQFCCVKSFTVVDYEWGYFSEKDGERPLLSGNPANPRKDFECGKSKRRYAAGEIGRAHV